MDDPDDHLMEQMQIYRGNMTMKLQGGATLLARVITAIGFDSGGYYYGKEKQKNSQFCITVFEGSRPFLRGLP